MYTEKRLAINVQLFVKTNMHLYGTERVRFGLYHAAEVIICTNVCDLPDWSMLKLQKLPNSIGYSVHFEYFQKKILHNTTTQITEIELIV